MLKWDRALTVIFKSLIRLFFREHFPIMKIDLISQMSMRERFSNRTKYASWLFIEKAKNTDVLNCVFLSPNQKGKQQVIFKETTLTFAQWSLRCMFILPGGDVLAVADDGASVLFEAAGGGNPDCISLLLEYGGSGNIPNRAGHLPIHRAAYEGHYLWVINHSMIPSSWKHKLVYMVWS